MIETVQRVALEGWKYVLKFQEKLHFICLNVENGKEITDEDYDLLRTVKKIEHDGEYPLYENKLDIPVTNVEQVGLFAGQSVSVSTIEGDNTTTILNGTELVTPTSETNKEE